MESETMWRVIAYVSMGLILGVFVTFVFTQPWIKKTTLEKWPTIELRQSSQFKPQGSEAISGPLTPPNIQEITIVTPKSSVSLDYHESLNALVKDGDAILNSNTKKLTPLLQQLNEKNTAGEYKGFFDLIVQAKESNAELKNFLRSFQNQLDRLRLANQTTTDSTISIATARLIISGTQFHESYLDYALVIDKLLDGERPSAKTLQDLQTSVDGIQKSSKVFADDLKQLLSAIAERIKADSAKTK